MFLSYRSPDVTRRDAATFWVSLAGSFALAALAIILRFFVYRDRIVPIIDALALLVCVWTRSRRLVWALALALIFSVLVKIIWILPPDQKDEVREWGQIAMLLMGIGVMAAVVHLLIDAHDWLEQKNDALAESNGELTASNEELAAREEEISRQNEELQSQTQELEQQTEELGQQSEELQVLNNEAARREQALQTLLQTSRWLRANNRPDLMDQICRVAGEMMEGHANAAAVLTREDERLVVRGHYGFGPEGPFNSTWAYDRAFASLVMKEGRTAYLEDTSLRPDLVIPQPVNGQPMRSLLASPLFVEGQIVGTLEVFSHEPRQWTDEDFKVIEWLAAQSSLVLESMSLQQELEQRRQQAEEASVRKTRFLAAVSHDVRTPAYAINLMAELIGRAAKDGELASQLPKLAADLQSNARSLVALVSDVLDLARFDSGKMELQLSDFTACSIIEAEVRQLMPLAQAKGLDLSVACVGRPVWIRADRMKLARVVGNLIGNAIKFTEKGSVSARCEHASDGGAEICVSDTGVGIPPEQVENIFDEFYQLRNPERDCTKGTGLGLAICRRLLDAMGCQISVKSALGKGSEFTVKIPSSLLIPQPRLPEQAAAIDVPDLALSGLQILLVEDHEMTRRATAQLLAAAGATVIQAATGSEALRILAHTTPTVMLLDLMLPDMDGTQVLRHVTRCRPPTLRCILVVSGDVTANRLLEVKQLGADGMVGKPIDVNDLIATIRSLAHPSDQVEHEVSPCIS